jgi:hypothetical protein
MQGMRIWPGDIEAYVEGDLGWFADRPRFVLLDGTEVPFRHTGVFRREGGEWKLVQAHTSLGIPNEDVIGFELTT